MKEAWQKILQSDPIEMIEFIDSIDLQSNAMEGTNMYMYFWVILRFRQILKNEFFNFFKWNFLHF